MEHSKQFDHLKQRYEQGRISLSMLRLHTKAGKITEKEFEEITGVAY